MRDDPGFQKGFSRFFEDDIERTNRSSQGQNAPSIDAHIYMPY